MLWAIYKYQHLLLVHQTPCKCSKSHACHAKAAAERRSPKRAKAYIRPRANAPSPTPATQKQRQSGSAYVNLCDVKLCDVKLCDVNLCDVKLCDVKLCDVNVLCVVLCCGVCCVLCCLWRVLCCVLCVVCCALCCVLCVMCCVCVCVCCLRVSVCVVRGGRRRRTEGGGRKEGGGANLKTRTPHVNVGKNCHLFPHFSMPGSKFFPECVARVPVSFWGLGVRLCSPSFAFAVATVGNRRQPSATVRGDAVRLSTSARAAGRCPKSESSGLASPQL